LSAAIHQQATLYVKLKGQKGVLAINFVPALKGSQDREKVAADKSNSNSGTFDKLYQSK
jgi:hypothetical protein